MFWAPLILLAWGTSPNSELERGLSLAAGDLDGDGYREIVTGLSTKRGGRLNIQWGLARGGQPASILIPEEPSFLHVADLDGDGPAEVIAARQGGHAIRFFRLGESGTLESAGLLAVPGELAAMTVGEFGVRDG